MSAVNARYRYTYCKMGARCALIQIFFVTMLAASASAADSSKLRFVGQLNVSGCPVVVHDTGASDGLHLAVEPMMCVKSGLDELVQRYDPVLDKTYVSIPVTLWDDSVLAEVRTQLRSLSPKSVKFARVFDISVSSDLSQNVRALGFDWVPEKPVGFLRISTGEAYGSEMSLVSYLKIGSHFALNSVLLTVSIASDANDVTTQLKYRPIVQNQNRLDASVGGQTYLPPCQLRFVQSIRINNCTARLHERQDRPGHFLIEPLLCLNLPRVTTSSWKYLELDVQLQSDIILNSIKARLAGMSPRSVTFMRLWRAESHLAEIMRSMPFSNIYRYDIGPLFVSGDGVSGQVRVYCNNNIECRYITEALSEDPFKLWRNVQWTVSSRVENQCQFTSFRYISESWINSSYDYDINKRWIDNCPETADLSTPPMQKKLCQLSSSKDGRLFVTIQQRLTGGVNFQRTWSEYENGFGDDSDFWIGLKAINSLSKNGTVLRVEMKLFNDAQLYAEYSGFQVGDSSTKYQMNYADIIWLRSNVQYDAMKVHKAMQFSTTDRDNDGDTANSCSTTNGKGGWWFNACQDFNPNGFFQESATLASCDQVPKTDTITWVRDSYSSRYSLIEVRLMLQI